MVIFIIFYTKIILVELLVVFDHCWHAAVQSVCWEYVNLLGPFQYNKTILPV